jgi:NitT/TauT family transport system substrate-binding protein
VVGLASLNTYAAFNMVAANGGDPSKVELVQLPFGQMTAALAAGDIDAAVLQAPFISDAVGVGGEIIGKPNVETFPDMAVGLYATTQTFIDGNEDVVRGFSEAVIEAQEAATANLDDARQTLVENLGITPEAASVAVWNTGSNPHVNVEGFEKAQQLLIAYGDQTEELDVNELVWPGALE